MLLFYIRHGDPIYDPDSLTSLGKRQAEAIAKRLALYGIDQIYASSSNRAMETALPTSELVKREIQILDWCHEHYAWETLTTVGENGSRRWGFVDAEIRKLFSRDDVRAMGRKWYEHPAFTNTQFAAGIQRVQQQSDLFLKSHGFEHDQTNNSYKVLYKNQKHIALFAHQGFGLAFLSCLLDVPYPIFSTHYDMTHTGMTVIEFSDSENPVIPCVLTLSNDSHLYREGLPTH